MRAFRLLPAVLLLAAGCAAPPAAPALKSEAPVSQARATALAKAGVLLPADLPGFRAAKPEAPLNAQEIAAQKGFWECMGHPERSFTASQSRDYVKGTLELWSSVDVAPTLRQSEDDFADFRNPAITPCLERAIRATGTLPPGITLKPFTHRPVKVAIPGTEAAGLVLTATLVRGGQSLSLHHAEVVARVGHAEVSVGALSEHRVPDTAMLTRLLAKAVQRVKAVKTP